MSQVVFRTRGGETVSAIVPSKVLRGYAESPGTGPADQTCKTCQHYMIIEYANKYRKCGLMRAFWTGGPGTDIKATSPACAKWEAKDELQAR